MLAYILFEQIDLYKIITHLSDIEAHVSNMELRKMLPKINLQIYQNVLKSNQEFPIVALPSLFETMKGAHRQKVCVIRMGILG